MSSKRASGFTLVEVMVALAVIAVALPALLFTLDQQLDGTRYLRERTLAQWVASNRVAELRLNAARSGVVATGRNEGEWELAAQTWYWSSEVTETPVPGFFRAEVRVAANDADETPAVAVMTAYLTAENALVAR